MTAHDLYPFYNCRYVQRSEHCYEKSNNGVPALAGFYRGKRSEQSDTLRKSGPEYKSLYAEISL